jgi:molybdopterin-guanine dinucleotide biosynthesis protein A
MGRDKALIRLDGSPMAVRVADALVRAGATSVVAVGGDRPALEAVGLTVWPDERPAAGPLAATITALAASTAEITLVVSCDLVAPSPAAMAATVQALADHPGAVAAVPVAEGRRQWTHTAWRDRARRTLVDAWERGDRSLREAGADLLVFEVTGLDPVGLADADEPGDLPPSALDRDGR